MDQIRQSARAFLAQNEEMRLEAAQRAALQLVCGIDMDSALVATGEERSRHIRRIERALRAERLKGLRRHWAYDLNRHIALKQALDRLRGDARIRISERPKCERLKRERRPFGRPHNNSPMRRLTVSGPCARFP